MTATRYTPADHEALIRRYFQACNAASYEDLVDCFTPDAVHYFPAGLPDVPWRSADTIARKWIWCVENLGSKWTIEKILVSHNSPEAVIEWTHWKTGQGTALRGDEWYRFDPETGKISEIRAYYAAPADKTAAINELVAFDYPGRGYHLKPE
ncbi:nuclear transport factor 2 family protein [Pusillimonas sp. SM2304]|uniref:nuclear transport factor 2 family protein n=1 Tax=Pusillimonas sp. SM2304 TaxID=3073241 RepID=UPI0028740675|nr:nuclear transport factor 2 family protein [Pusillimonas sp. SM2304]MDS1139664.1 nuclear transport factor 2 family protein [Pusillimonas sp. SM2304]